jgi:hypothetical protein
MGLLSIDRRQIAKADLYTKARILAEGVRVEIVGTGSESQQIRRPAPMEGPEDGDELTDLLRERRVQTEEIEQTFNDIFILERSEIPTPIRRDSRSPLLLEIDGRCGRLLENSSEIARGTILSSREDLPWCGRMIDGIPAESILYASSPGIINIEFHVSCYNHIAGMPCLYCGIYASPVFKKLHDLSIDSLQRYAALQARALEAATDRGWRGMIAISGGALPPEVRKHYLERIEVVVNAIHRTLDSEVVDELTLAYCHYPPEDFSDFRRLRDMGIQATSMDLEVVGDEAFRRICPGKHAYKPLDYWREAQEAAVEVFGPYWNTSTLVVVGLETIDTLVEGVKERLSKGVMVVPIQFVPAPGSLMEKARLRDADWIMEATERLVDCYAPYGPMFLKRLASTSLHGFFAQLNPWNAEKAAKNSLGWMRMKLYPHMPVADEMVRRIMKVPGARLLPLPKAV